MSSRTTVRSSTGSMAFDLLARLADVSQSLASLAPVPALSLAAATAGAIINLVAEVKANKTDCVRIAFRASRMLLDLGSRMEGKWDSAPAALLDNVREFECTLIGVRDFMVKASEEKWVKRLLAKNSFQDAVHDFHARLDAAAQSFQLASLIEIHYAIGRLQSSPITIGSGAAVVNAVSSSANADLLSSCLDDTAVVHFTPSAVVESITDIKKHSLLDHEVRDEPCTAPSGVSVEDMSEVNNFLAQLDGEKDEFGFRRYHQSDVRIGRPNRRGVGWFSRTGEAQVHGEKVTIKRYDSDPDEVRKWVKDIKMLRQLFHANIPQMVGYSDGKSNVPFILLANGPTKDIGLYVESVLKTESLAGCVRAFLGIYRDIVAATVHIQQQLNLTDENVQDYVENATYTVDGGNSILMGLVPPKEGWVTIRSYNLAESLSSRALKYLKDLENAEESAAAGSAARSSAVGRTRQLRSLLVALLPRKTDTLELCSKLEDLLDDDPCETNLSKLRGIAIGNGRHDHSWRERCSPGILSVGDYGYMPQDSKDFAAFKVLGNINDASAGDPSALSLLKDVEGTYVHQGNRSIQRKPANPFLLPDDLEGWPIAMMPQAKVTVFVQRQQRLEPGNEIWRHFLAYAPSLAKRHDIDAHSLILVTRVLNVNDFQVNDFSPPRLNPPRHPNMPHFPVPMHRQPNHFHNSFHAVPDLPTIIYLFTSGKAGFGPYITDSPMGVPRPQELRSTNWCYSCRAGWPVEYADYIQFDVEDFM